jgi:hypothetical protein
MFKLTCPLVRRPVVVLAALAAGLLTGCDCLCHKKKNNGPDWALIAAERANGGAGLPGAGGAGGGATGGTGGGGGGGGGPVPEIHPGAAAGVLTLVFGSILILRDRRRPMPVVECA